MPCSVLKCLLSFCCMMPIEKQNSSSCQYDEPLLQMQLSNIELWEGIERRLDTRSMRVNLSDKSSSDLQASDKDSNAFYQARNPLIQVLSFDADIKL